MSILCPYCVNVVSTVSIVIISCQNVPMCVNIVSLLSQCGVHTVYCEYLVSIMCPFCLFCVSVVSIVESILSIVFILCPYGADCAGLYVEPNRLNFMFN